MKKNLFFAFFLVGFSAVSNLNSNEVQDLKQRIQILETKNEILKKEAESLRQENQKINKEKRALKQAKNSMHHRYKRHSFLKQ